ncbi:hypothetical protein CCACVL1_22949 [Corchorus capsularis]|uniref:Uncharacterized protein n=1 Tax=Corchorus capsularis TaxID=210143 RepID=A0A1R3GVT7_COCAP|nr:hypothetical protein CCACVL1_22949 [Corchorus capsularis]
MAPPPLVQIEQTLLRRQVLRVELETLSYCKN